MKTHLIINQARIKKEGRKNTLLLDELILMLKDSESKKYAVGIECTNIDYDIKFYGEIERLKNLKKFSKLRWAEKYFNKLVDRKEVL